MGLDLQYSKDIYTIVLTRVDLIDMHLCITGLKNSKPNSILAESTPLGKDIEADYCRETYDYMLVIGMILSLVGSLAPDISYAMHQYVRFSHGPKHSHDISIKHMSRHLNGTSDKGHVIKSNMEGKSTIQCVYRC